MTQITSQDASFGSFFGALDLPKDVADQAQIALKSEHVTFQQLLTMITDEDLEEIGIGEEARKAILNRAQVLYDVYFFNCPHEFFLYRRYR